MLAAFAATLSFVQPSISSAAARHTCCRGGCVRSIEWPPAGIVITMFSGVAIFARPESPLWDLIQPEAAVVSVPAISSLCRDDGWELRLSIGRDMARSVDVALQVRFERDGRFGEYPQGTAALRRPSKFFASTGLWSAVSEAGDERHSLEMRLECGESRCGVRVPVSQISTRDGTSVSCMRCSEYLARDRIAHPQSGTSVLHLSPAPQSCTTSFLHLSPGVSPLSRCSGLGRDGEERVPPGPLSREYSLVTFHDRRGVDPARAPLPDRLSRGGGASDATAHSLPSLARDFFLLGG